MRVPAAVEGRPASFGSVVRRGTVARAAVALALAGVLGIGVVGAGSPAPAVATAPAPVVPLTQAAFRTTVSTDHALTDPVAITFSTPMNRASVSASLQVEPATPVILRWDPGSTVATIAPQTTWTPDTFHTISVRPGALAQSGQPLARPARAVFVTRPATVVELSATDRVDDRVLAATAFQVTFVGPVNAATVSGAIRLDPPVAGSLQVRPSPDGTSTYAFVPSAPLRPDVRYRVEVSGVRDPDGSVLEPVSLAVRTEVAPTVEEFRPKTGSLGVPSETPVSVRFSRSMDPRSTAAALSVSIDGKPVAGSIRWTDSNTVLTFTPKSPFPRGTKVAAEIGAAAKGSTGVHLDEPATAIFRTVEPPPPPTPKPTPAAAPAAAGAAKPAAKSAAKPAAPAKSPTRAPAKGSSSGGSAAGGGSWAAVEAYYLELMNCTRTGGWVTSNGTCSSPGGRDVAPLKLDAGISSKVARPYAKLLATRNLCSHFIGGSPANRLKAAGYPSHRWAENLGCRSGDARAAVLASHLFFQSERSYNGGHYVNLMNPAFDRVGIGVWVSNGRVRLVIDFYQR